MEINKYSMVTIGENLKYERYEVIEVDSHAIELKSVSNKSRQILLSEIKSLQVTGIKSSSGYSGTMEWGMRNPTFILPTTIWNNILTLFKRRSDIMHYIVTLSDDRKILIYCSNGSFNQRLKQIAEK